MVLGSNVSICAIIHKLTAVAILELPLRACLCDESAVGSHFKMTLKWRAFFSLRKIVLVPIFGSINDKMPLHIRWKLNRCGAKICVEGNIERLFVFERACDKARRGAPIGMKRLMSMPVDVCRC